MTRIVIGVDGSEHAVVALRWAVEEGALHSADVEAVLAWSLLDQHHPDRAERFDPDYGDDAARATLAAWVADALGPDATVALRTVNDLPAPAVLTAGDVADLIVLGARGTGGFEGLLLGSTSERVAQLASGPVAVVREHAPVRGGRVVVGVDGSARSRDALRWAADEARARDAELDVVHTWRIPMKTMSMGYAATTVAALEDAGRSVLERATGDPMLRGIRMTPHLTSDSPARALLRRSEGAGLLVVGTRGLGRVAGALLGSVSRQMLHHARCPVVVV
jgi:nucleotide-binding universal stress UspA family protein